MSEMTTNTNGMLGMMSARDLAVGRQVVLDDGCRRRP